MSDDGTNVDNNIPTAAQSHSESTPSSSAQTPRSRLQGGFVDAKSGQDSTEDSEEPFDHLSPAASDRVFPIRSAISVGHTPISAARTSKDGAYGFPSERAPSITASGGSIAERRSKVNSNTLKSTLSTPFSGPKSSQAHPPSRSLTASESVDVPSLSDKGVVRVERTRASVDNGAAALQRCFDSTSDKTDGIPSAADGEMASESGSTQSHSRSPEPLYTARFKHVVTKDGHAVVVGRDGDTLQRCEDEPIHIPGAIQSYGLLIALQEVEEGKLQVKIVSENSGKIIGYTPQKLFALGSFCDVLSEEQAENLLERIDFIRDEDADPAVHGPEVFLIIIKSPEHRSQKLWCAMHINIRNKDLIICEFELENDSQNPLAPAGEDTPELPEDTLHGDPTEEELAESTTAANKPLRVLRNARKRHSAAAAMDVFNIMSQVQDQLANASNLDVFLKVLIGVVKELTGFHRVMIYQFDQAWNGRVVTELVDPRATKDLYKGLNFPASDIPKQARDLYKINKVRLLYDRDQETARLVCKTIEDLENPLDLTYSYLRAMSPIHIKYLANMAVRSSLSISINAFGELWGLIACHTYGSKGMRVSFPVRKMCRIVGDSASRNIERLSYASRLQARKLINTVPSETNPSGYIIASSEDLLTLFDADCGLLSIREETKMLGSFPQAQEALAVLAYLRTRRLTSVTHSVSLLEDFPDLHYEPGFQLLAGFLHVPLTVTGNDFIVFFRRSQRQEVKWAGNPYEKFVKEGTEGYLEPRKSFKMWTEIVQGRCTEWTEEQIETASVLCLVYGKFIEVWRQKEAALQSVPLTRLLLANTAHEVRTPLNHIINYLEIAMEGNLDQETRENLTKSHSASKSLIYVINDLLDLTKAVEGKDLILDEVFDFPSIVRTATDPFSSDAKRKQIAYSVHDNGGIPTQLKGDSRRLRQIISNVTANAIKNTTVGAVRVELWLVEKTEDRAIIEISVHDTGCGISTKKLDAIFNELEEIQTESDEDLERKLGSDAKMREDDSFSTRTLGLGLAVVARTIRNMEGQLRLKSEEGKGSRVIMQLGFDLPSQEGTSGRVKQLDSICPPGTMALPVSPPPCDGEILLVDKSPRTSSLKAPTSVENMNSMRIAQSQLNVPSNSSAGTGEVDRLIDAIREPSGGSRSPRQRKSSGQPPRAPSRRSSSTTQIIQCSPISGASQGQALVTDSKTPVTAIKVPGHAKSGPAAGREGNRPPSKALFEPDSHPRAPTSQLGGESLRVLVAEDDPINSRLIKKRLEKVGHSVHLTANGEECASAYGDDPSMSDVVLMDMQMPIADGLTSTKMIRSFEKSAPHIKLSHRAKLHGRVPVLAVSASLEESKRRLYIDVGFDGWVLKPIDFPRLQKLLKGVVDRLTRESCLYVNGQWEQGGWFLREQPDPLCADTTPAGEGVVGGPAPPKSFPGPAGPDARDRERDRSESLEDDEDDDAIHAASKPSGLGISGVVDNSTLGA